MTPSSTARKCGTAPHYENDVQALRARVTEMIDRELDRCRSLHGPDNWAQYGDWVKSYEIASAKQWLMQEASKGAL